MKCKDSSTASFFGGRVLEFLLINPDSASTFNGLVAGLEGKITTASAFSSGAIII